MNDKSNMTLRQRLKGKGILDVEEKDVRKLVADTMAITNYLKEKFKKTYWSLDSEAKNEETLDLFWDHKLTYFIALASSSY